MQCEQKRTGHKEKFDALADFLGHELERLEAVIPNKSPENKI